MKKTIPFLSVLALFVSITASSQTIRERIQERRAEKVGKEQENSVAPDYSDLYFWAAHPAKKDRSDSIPSFISNETRDTLADVFFLHPTTYTKDMRNSIISNK